MVISCLCACGDVHTAVLYLSFTSFFFFFLEISSALLSAAVVKATFLSVLDYADIIYMHAAAQTLKPLDAVYHSSLRFIRGDRFRTCQCAI